MNPKETKRSAVPSEVQSEIEEAEQVRWQERIEATIAKTGLEPADASGVDSGDPLDYTDYQVRAALTELSEALVAADNNLRADDGRCPECRYKGCHESDCSFGSLCERLRGGPA